jgi:hypothetical protein
MLFTIYQLIDPSLYEHISSLYILLETVCHIQIHRPTLLTCEKRDLIEICRFDHLIDP